MSLRTIRFNKSTSPLQLKIKFPQEKTTKYFHALDVSNLKTIFSYFKSCFVVSPKRERERERERERDGGRLGSGVRWGRMLY